MNISNVGYISLVNILVTLFSNMINSMELNDDIYSLEPNMLYREGHLFRFCENKAKGCF